MSDSDSATEQLERVRDRMGARGHRRAASSSDARRAARWRARYPADLLVSDPAADTWDVSTVRELRYALGRRAAELGLPSVSVTLVPEAEAEAFGRVA